MAMNKIERIDKEIQKTREKITEYQNKLKTLEVQRTEAENLQIVQLVRAMNMTPAELTALLSGGVVDNDIEIVSVSALHNDKLLILGGFALYVVHKAHIALRR